MDIGQAYRLADSNPAYYAMGIRLEPYSAGHERLLTATENSFLEAPERCDFRDFITGVYICAFPWKESAKLLSSRWRWLALRYWGWRSKKLDIVKEMAAFASYLDANREDCWGGFNLIHEHNDPSPTPGLHSMRVFLAMHIGLSEAEFWDRPLILSRADYWAALEIKSAVHPVSQATKEAFAAAKE